MITLDNCKSFILVESKRYVRDGQETARKVSRHYITERGKHSQ